MAKRGERLTYKVRFQYEGSKLWTSAQATESMAMSKATSITEYAQRTDKRVEVRVERDGVVLWSGSTYPTV